MAKGQRSKDNIPVFSSKSGFILPVCLALITLASFVWLACIPRDPDGGILLGYSLSRLALLALLFFVFAALITLIVLRAKNAAFRAKLAGFFARRYARLGLFVFSLVAFLGAWHLLFFFHLLSDFNPFLKDRLLPITVWMLAGSLLLLLRLPKTPGVQTKNRREFNAWLPFLIAFGLLLLFWILVCVFGLGSDDESTTVSDLGVPLLEWQIVYTCGLLAAGGLGGKQAAALGLLEKRPSKRTVFLLELGLFLGIWLLAAFLWLRQPLPQNNYFAPAPLPPNHETYPFSDAQRYSLDALQLLRGDTRSEIISKPMFIQYLAGLHLLGGLDYERVVFFQTLVLALFPALLFLIGRQLGSRLLGLGAALFAILREVNFIQASDIANVSNSKLLMTDFPYTLGICLLALLTIRWLQEKDERALSLILIGGLLAVNCLLRPQTLILVPLYGLLVLIKHCKRWKQILLSFGLIVMILLLTILPLLIRNYVVGDYFWFDAPDYMNKFASSYALSNIAGDEDLNEGLASTVSGGQSAHGVLSAFSAVNSKLLTGIANNFFRNILSAFLQFPVRYNASIPLDELTGIEVNFWAETGNYQNPADVALALLNCLLFSLGIARLWRKDAKVLAALLGLFIFIDLSSALFRFSGWRFIMPVDWIFYFLYLEGLAQLAERAAGRPAFSPDVHTEIPSGARLSALPKGHWLPEALVALCFVISGALIPIREAFIKDAAPASREALCTQLTDLLDEQTRPVSKADLYNLCLSEESYVTGGTLVYPRYFRSGYGYVERPNPYYGTLDYGRMSFYVLDRATSRYYIPFDNPQGLGDFRNGSAVILLSRQDLLPELQAIAVVGEEGSLVFSSKFTVANLE